MSTAAMGREDQDEGENSPGDSCLARVLEGEGPTGSSEDGPAWSWENACVLAKSLQLCATLSDLMDCSLPGSRSLGFSRQECWSGVPLPSPLLSV